MQESSDYTGRFAPSPTGPLHFGSLVAALASYLDAKYNKGKWLVRMEDIDPPREQPGAAQSILKTLDEYGLHWDGSVLYQSTRLARYQEVVETLTSNAQAFPCSCSRQQLAGHTLYPGTCRQRLPDESSLTAIRLIARNEIVSFSDAIQGRRAQHMANDIGDFVIRRKDGLIAYQLAVALDDAQQQITRVIRGCDLLDSTFRQIYIMKLLGLSPPAYCHIPVIVDQHGQKLSKQSYARPLDKANRRYNLLAALQHLNQNPPDELKSASVTEILEWSITHWRLEHLPKTEAIPL